MIEFKYNTSRKTIFIMRSDTIFLGKWFVHALSKVVEKEHYTQSI
jgi:hypothetical protein